MKFISIKEACELVSKSQPTISNFCKKHANTKHIKKDKNRIYIDKDFLLESFKQINAGKKQIEKSINNDIILILKDQLTEKDKQINELIQRNKELNINQNELINKLTLLESNTNINEDTTTKEDLNSFQKLLKKWGLIQD